MSLSPTFVCPPEGMQRSPPEGTQPAPHPALSLLPPPDDSVLLLPAPPTAEPVHLTEDGIAAVALKFSKPPLGKGGFSTVYEGLFYGAPAAVKILAIRNEHERANFHEELRSLLNPALRSEHVCPLLGYCKAQPAFIFPRLTCINVSRMTRFPDDVKDSICIDTADGLATLHAAGYVHMDIKPDNVLLLFDENRRIQKALVGDLGCVKSVAVPVYPYGTIAFLDPQLNFQQLRKPQPADDVFSLGITFLSIWTNRVPTSRDEIPLLMQELRRACAYRFELVASMTAIDIRRRPTAAFVRDTVRARQKASWDTRGGYPWSGRIPPITQPPFIGEGAAERAAAAGFAYQPPPPFVPPQQQQGATGGGYRIVMGPSGQLMIVPEAQQAAAVAAQQAAAQQVAVQQVAAQQLQFQQQQQQPQVQQAQFQQWGQQPRVIAATAMPHPQMQQQPLQLQQQQQQQQQVIALQQQAMALQQQAMLLQQQQPQQQPQQIVQHTPQTLSSPPSQTLSPQSFGTPAGYVVQGQPLTYQQQRLQQAGPQQPHYSYVGRGYV